MLKIEVLNKSHNRTAFDCGHDELNQYIRKTTRQHVVKGISKTFVVINEAQENTILGFFTLSFCEIESIDLPPTYSKKFPRKVPAAKLARLAVSRQHQQQGLGKYMMINAIEKTLLVSKNIGIIGFFVDAKDDAAKKYYEQFGFLPMPENKLQLFIPLKGLNDIIMSY